MIRAYDDYGNVVDLVEWENQIRKDTIAEISREIRLLYGNDYEKQIRAEVIDELYNKIDEGVCDICEYQNFDGGCFKTCTFEMENAKRWLLQLKEQNK